MEHLKPFFSSNAKMISGFFSLAALLLFVMACKKTHNQSVNSIQSVNPNMSSLGYLKPSAIVWLPTGPTMSAAGGIGSGRLSALAKDSTNTILLMGGFFNTGIYRSADGGKTWATANQGLTTSDGLTDPTIQGLCFLPKQDKIALAITSGSIYRSTDGGQSWAAVYSLGYSGYGACSAFAFSGNLVFAATKAGLLRSTDQGVTWTTDVAGNASTVMNASSGLTFASVAVSGGSYLYQFTNGTWNKLGHLDASAQQIAVRPDNNSIIYAALNDGSYDQAVWASTDGGNAFSKVNFDTYGAQSIAFSTVYPHRLWIEGDEGSEYTDNPDGQLSPAYVKKGTGLDTRCLYLEPNTAGTDDRGWFISDQGIFSVEVMSTMGNITSHNNGLHTNAVTGFAVSSDGQNIVAGIQDYSGGRSNDGNLSWQSVSIGEDGGVAFAPNNPKLCYFMNGSLRVSQDAGKTFTTTISTMSGTTFQGQKIAFDPVIPSNLYVATGTSAGGFQVSHDAGQTFTATGWQISGNASSIAIDPKDNKHLLMAGSQYGYVTHDGGNTITQIQGLPLSGNIYFAVNPRNSKSVVIAVGSSVYTSTDGGNSCTLSYTLPAGSGSANGLAFNPDAPANKTPALVLCANNASYISGDAGKTWERLDVTTITHNVHTIQWLNNTLYLGTYGQGIIKSSMPMQ